MTSIDLATVLAQRPLGLAFDIDGTLSPIAPTPGEARLYPGVDILLEEMKKYAQVVIVTGRSVENGAPIVNVEGLTYIGTHGMEWCDGLPSTHPVRLISEAEPYVEPGNYLLDLVKPRRGRGAHTDPVGLLQPLRGDDLDRVFGEDARSLRPDLQQP